MMDKWYVHYGLLFIFSVIFTFVSYYSSNVASAIYDYPFHLGRIVGLAQSIANQDYLPSLNYLFLNGSGYAVAMFYGNWLFYLPALVFLQTKVATFAFATFVWYSTFLTLCSSFYTLNKINQDSLNSFLGSVAISCSIVYFGFGMTAVVPLIPLLIYAIYKVIFEDKRNPLLLGVVIALLIQTHVISTVVLAFFSFLLVLLNVHRLTVNKILSFFYSILISIPLMTGFFLQYFEQNQSQEFFVNWRLRDFPFPTHSLMSPGDLFSSFENYYWPIAFALVLLFVFTIRNQATFGKQLVIASIIMFFAATQLLPWEILRESFLAVFQNTGRLTYLLPVVILFALSLSQSRIVVLLAAVMQVTVYILNFPMQFTPNKVPYEEIGFQNTVREMIDITNRDAMSAYEYPFLGYTYDTSGDEYLTIDVNHENIRNGSIKEFEFDEDLVEISNIKNGYNHLSFDINLDSKIEGAEIILPRIWYKGYIAEYSNGSSGEQPHLKLGRKTAAEIRTDTESGKSTSSEKVLFDGRSAIMVNSSGHVQVYYKKTRVQIIGFFIETIAFVTIFIFAIYQYLKKKNSLGTTS